MLLREKSTSLLSGENVLRLSDIFKNSSDFLLIKKILSFFFRIEDAEKSHNVLYRAERKS